MTIAVTELEVIEAGLRWIEDGYSVALATVIETWGSAPRKAGSQLLIRADGVFLGSVSGGCVEGAVIRQTMELLTGEKHGQRLSFGVSTEDAWSVGLSCGGEISIWVERAQSSVLQELIVSIRSRIQVGLYLPMKDETMTVVQQWSSTPTFTSLIQSSGHALCLYTPSPRIFIIGAVHIAQALVPMVQGVGYEVIVIDPRSIFLESERWFHVKRVSDFPEEYLPTQNMSSHDAVVALSHNPTFDDEALLLALEADAFYVGALGSRKNHAKRCGRLQNRGLSTTQVSRISGPIGLNIGAQTPSEIAVSILAELIQAHRTRTT